MLQEGFRMMQKVRCMLQERSPHDAERSLHVAARFPHGAESPLHVAGRFPHVLAHLLQFVANQL